MNKIVTNIHKTIASIGFCLGATASDEHRPLQPRNKEASAMNKTITQFVFASALLVAMLASMGTAQAQGAGPTNLVAVSGPFDNQITLSWTAPTIGSPPYSYTIRRVNVQSDGFRLRDAILTTTNTEVVITDLKKTTDTTPIPVAHGQEYIFDVAAVASGGVDAGASAEVTITAEAPVIPVKDNTATYTDNGDGTTQVTFTPTGAGLFEIRWRQTGRAGFLRGQQNVTGGQVDSPVSRSIPTGYDFDGEIWITLHGDNTDYARAAHTTGARPDTTAPVITFDRFKHTGGVVLSTGTFLNAGDTLTVFVNADEPLAESSLEDAAIFDFDTTDRTAQNLLPVTNVANQYMATYTITPADNDAEAGFNVRGVTDTADLANTTPDFRHPLLTVTFDTVAPTITLEGGPVTLDHGSDIADYTDASVSGVDGAAGETLETTIAGPDSATAVDTTKPGDYTYTYTATDRAGNVATRTRTVTAGVATKPTVVAPTEPIEFAENATGTVVTFTATPSGGNAITGFTLGGTDAAAFSITNTGVLTFSTPPNYEAPTDAGANNGYDITITATDDASETSDELEVTVRVTNLEEGVGTVTISGIAQVGMELIAGTVTDDPDGFVSVERHQWQRVDGGGTTEIGADQSTYTLVEADEGKTIQALVTYTDEEGSGKQATSARTGVVIPAGSRSPFTLTAGAITSTSVVINWNREPSGTDRYDVYRGDTRHETVTNERARTYTDRRAEPGTTYTYYVQAVNPFFALIAQTGDLTITTQAADATLSALALTDNNNNAVALVETFAPATTDYTTNLAAEVTSIRIRPTVTDAPTNPSDPAAAVTVDDTTVTSGALSEPITLEPGNNIITIKVTAEDTSVTETYTLTVTRPVPAPSIALAADTGTETDDGITNDGVVNVTGLASGATWTHTIKSTTSAPLADTTTTFTLPEGVYETSEVQVVQTVNGVDSEPAMLARQITVDTTAPAIALVGVSLVTLDHGSNIANYTDASVSGVNAAAGETLETTIAGPDSATAVDTTTPGDYTYTYTATDRAGNVATRTRTVTVNAAGVVATKPTVVAPTEPIEFAENATGTVVTFTATPSGGNVITGFTLGGTDAAAFSITNTGVLTFSTPPNYEAPTDAGANNGYDITITATDDASETSDELEVTVRVTNLEEGVGTVTISGIAQVGMELTAGTVTDDPDGFVSVERHQWQRVDGGGTTEIGADQSTYTLVEADEGKTIQALVTYTDEEGSGKQATSARTGVVIPAGSRSPFTLTAGAITSTSVVINWNREPSGTDRYDVYRGDTRHETVTNERARTYTDMRAEPGTTYTYYVQAVNPFFALIAQTGDLTITTQAADATLLALALTDNNNNAVALVETFAPATTDYTTNLAAEVTSIRIRPTVTDAPTNPSDPAAAVTVDDTTVTSGALSEPITLEPGNNIITIKVTAEDTSVTETYTLTVTRPVPAPSIALAADTGTETDDGITNDGVVNVTGLASGATWTHTIKSTTSASLADTTTTFTLPEGVYETSEVRVVQTVNGVDSEPAMLARQITVDTTAPAIALVGVFLVTLDHGSDIADYTDASVSGVDAAAGETLETTIAGPDSATAVDTTKPGDYTYTYTATDRAGNVATRTRTVTVAAVELPGISDLDGESGVSLDDAKFLYYAHALGPELDNPDVQTRVLGPLNTEADADDLLSLLTAAKGSLSGDLNADGATDDEDAAVLYYSFALEGSLGDGSDDNPGFPEIKRAILGPLAGTDDMEAIDTMLRRVYELRGP